MAASLERNLPSVAQMAKIASRKTSVPMLERTGVDWQNPDIATTDTYFGEAKDTGELKKLSAVYADPQQRNNFGYSYHSFGHGFDPAADIIQLDIQKTLVDTKEPSLELNKPDSAEHSDTSIKEQLDTINRAEHSELIKNSVQNRAEWREGIPDKTRSGKIYDLNFSNLRELIGQEDLNKIRNTHIFKDYTQTEDKADTLIQTLEDIGRLTDEDIAQMDTLPVTKEALTLIRDELTSNGEYDEQKARAFEKMLMNYPPNKENYIDGIPDYGRWLGEIKAGFRVIGEELIIDKGEMYFTATPQNQPRNPQLVFRAGNDTYTLTYDITKMETITIRINDGNSELVSNVREYLREHNVSLKSLKQGFSTVGVKEFPGNDGTLGHLPSEISSVLYLNRLEMLNAIQLLDSGETQSFEYNGINYEFKHEGRGGIIAQDEGNIYTITIGEQRATILMPETDGNDIPLICFDNVTENDLPDRGGYNVKRIYATDGKIWIVASGTNFRNINDAYNSTAVQYSRYNKAKSDFWRLNRIFFGGN